VIIKTLKNIIFGLVIKPAGTILETGKDLDDERAQQFIEHGSAVEYLPDESGEKQTDLLNAATVNAVPPTIGKYEVSGKIIIIPPGVKLELSPEQYDAREKNLSEQAEGLCETVKFVRFKKGEIIGIMSPEKSEQLRVAISKKDITPVLEEQAK
jgi:hypothetical protein